MNCPFCAYEESKVVDSRPSDKRIRRRRECMKCGGRFTTYEAVEYPLLMVEKKDGNFESFNKNKLIGGIYSAIKKRPVSVEKVTEIADYVENYFANSLRTVAKSREIGEIVLEKLREIDPIAYIRFASVYEDFTDIESFVSVIRDLENKKETETSEKKVGEEKKNG